MATTYEFNVEMTCGGCSGAITRILTKKLTEESDKFDVNLDAKKVTITSEKPYEELLDYLKKSGKAAEYVGTK